MASAVLRVYYPHIGQLYAASSLPGTNLEALLFYNTIPFRPRDFPVIIRQPLRQANAIVFLYVKQTFFQLSFHSAGMFPGPHLYRDRIASS